jgi:poly(A) polymerase
MGPLDPSRLTWKENPAVRAVMIALGAREGLARFVGGCVRNSVMGLPITDIDIATVHPPQETIRLLGAAGISAKPTGIAHGTITAVIEGRPFEITTLRRDIETDGRHAVVAFTQDWSEDAARRDFTMNALFMNLDGEVLDPVGGRQDAKDGRVRFVGEPDRRIQEDALRILRFFRFQAQYGNHPLDPAGLVASRRNAALQTKLSGERIRAELLKLLGAPGAGPVVRAMVTGEILTPLFPTSMNIDDLDRLIILENRHCDGKTDAIRRIAVLFGDCDPAFIDRLKFSNAQRDRLLAISRDRLGPTAPTDDLKASIYKVGASRFTDAILVTAARDALGPAAVDAALDLARTWIPPRFPLRGADIVKLGLAPGERVGRILAEIETLWISDGMRGDHEICLSWARQASEQDGIET